MKKSLSIAIAAVVPRPRRAASLREAGRKAGREAGAKGTRVRRGRLLEWLLIIVVAPGSSTGLSGQTTSASVPLQTIPVANRITVIRVGPFQVPVSPASDHAANSPDTPYKYPFYPAAPVTASHSRQSRHDPEAQAATAAGQPPLLTDTVAVSYKAAQNAVAQNPVPALEQARARYQPSGQAPALPAGAYPGAIRIEAADSGEVLHLPVGRSMVLSTEVALRRIYVGDAKILQSFSSGPREDVITARSCGSSTLILWDVAGRRRIYTVYSDLDTEGLSNAIAAALPDARVSLTAMGNRLSLEGTVPSEAAADVVYKLAATYSKNVVDGVRIVAAHSRQIELKLRIVEVDRSRLAQYGVNFFALGGSTLAGTSTQQFSTTVTPPTATTALTVSDPLNLLLYSAKLNAGVTIKDLEEKQVLQVLAEPTLTTLSGITARFLSGGEFPLPVVQGGTGNSTAITIVWKPYGVKVEFTPTANEDGTIRLKVAPEVSTLDYTNAVTIAGFVIPALSTRKADTEVELRDGQSFILSGLLDHRTSDNLSHMPGIASIPILGQLFRSKGVTLSTVDLVVIVTATMVDPLSHPLPVSEPAMILPNLDKQRFDQDVTRRARGSRSSAASPVSGSVPGGPPAGVAP